ncbi:MULTISPECIES: sulfite exporter TauE/SafE family protein [Marinobacterium]|jgi:sulfite exporter TauE/SafE|uniref:Urease accessory protein UreH-like transmembrane domain-containing protein n=2 Tax=Gammaproteobacteria TaxID=1236 RepID=A0A1H3ZQ30_9GAMM|nr:sulfite exporter TauE/SafE family protein [Marinobacterium iners]SEA25810.1 hypothetical protein SAMN02745729_102126 [Marinobacterium iners DSM 11526]
MPEPALLASALLFGLAGSTHCIGMCGGIAGSLAMSGGERVLRFQLAYNLGRLFSYALAGALIGQLGQLFTQTAELTLILRSVAALIMVVMGLYIAGWWQGAAYLERAGGVVWRRLQPFTHTLLPADTLPKALLLGALWGWLPCGLVYTTLLWAGTVSNNSLTSASLMLVFGAGTLPALLTSALLARQLKQLLQRSGVRQGAGLLVILFGLATLPWTGLLHPH